MPAKVISFINSKGGTGKTTSAVNVAAQLRMQRKKVLLVDLDPQANATIMYGLDKEQIKAAHVGHALLNPDDFIHTIYKVNFVKKDGHKKLKRDIDICPSYKDLDDVCIALMPQISRETRLKKCIDNVRDSYDYIILDCPPNYGLCSVNALAASDFYIPVADCEPLSMINLEIHIDIIKQIQQNINSSLTCLGVLFTKYNATKIHNKTVAIVTEAFNNNVFNINIPNNIKFPEAFNMPICSHAPNSKGNIAYFDAVKELLRRVKKYS